ncbi:type 12 methyltransferase [Methylobacterium sp. GXF4]|uniref:Class I SAM-dependent methyltransferase n=1 Tax=Methylobacterium brachiatum TaxID=269660 RepID=A0ABV1R1K8_9HYPH|nr:class I SAM-dependent methyltransferase [Methylobacterium sp. GXF4]EIZ81960.1 type 12 methyltransferase [Methylobacterium sp. GXF4]
MAGDTEAGQAIYNSGTLQLYDLVVLRLSNPLIWRCPTARILALYDRHVGAAHLDVGVGTGWYLDRCRFPTPAPRIGLMDLNADSLDYAARRIARYRPERYRLDVLGGRPATGIAPFASIGLTYLLHCLPGDIAAKAAAFDTVRPCLRDDGTVFGATILSGGVPTTAAARALMRVYNRKGVFSNTGDTLPALRAALDQRFRSVEITVEGCVALFAAQGPR